MKTVLGALAAAGLPAALGFLFLRAESERAVAAVLLAAVALALVATRTQLLQPVERAVARNERLTHAFGLLAVVAVCLAFREDDFALFLVARVLIVAVACLGLNVQFGYAGVVNFAGATFFGVGGYTAAVLTRGTGLPHLIVLLCGGAASALAGSALLLPVLRTRGHYAALVTIAFALLFRTFIEVSDALGGPQGLKLPGLRILGWRFNDAVEVGPFSGSFYLNYIAVALALLVAAFVVVRRLERSWIGLALDAVRIDETAAACFGLNVARWKITAFTLGNFLAGAAGALSALMVGFIAPNNYAFGESLVLVSILLLGGIGNPWGLLLATVIVMLLPEKLQLIQEYRFLLYAAMVILILLFRPAGLLPRPLRRWATKSA